MIKNSVSFKGKENNVLSYWWLIRVTLVVGLVFLPKNFGPVGRGGRGRGYEGLLLFCECTWGGGSVCRWWGHLTAKCCNCIFCVHRWWTRSHPLV